MSQLIAQLFQAGAVKVKLDLLLVVLLVNQSTIQPLKSTRKTTTPWRCDMRSDIRCDILEFLVVQCLVKSGAVHSG